ncbi:hypothetical protein ID866_5554 [Astraeus odoratus]|nr:hypothetical protein ID866_5554 [Astraeus odoratus]
MPCDRISTLLTWCTDNGIIIDPRIQVIDHDVATRSCHGSPSALTQNVTNRETSREHGICVYSCDQFIESPCTLVYIPKSAVLSVRSCFFSAKIIPIPYGHGAQLSLALALYGELLRGSHSRWFGYLQSLPHETVDIAVFWGNPDVGQTIGNDYERASRVGSYSGRGISCYPCARIRDGQTARAWLEATEAEKELRDVMVSLSINGSLSVLWCIRVPWPYSWPMSL